MRKALVIGSRLIHTLLYAASLIGCGLKLGPVAIIDEIGLVFSVWRQLLVTNITFKLNFYSLTLVWFFLITVLGFIFSQSPNQIRFVVMSVSLLMAGRVLDGCCVDIFKLRWIAVLYIMINIIFGVCEYLFGWETAWWQEWLWTGTAYSSLGIFISALILLITSEGIVRKYLIVFMVVLAALATESRISLLFAVLLLIGVFLQKSHGIVGNCKKFMIFIFFIFISFVVYKTGYFVKLNDNVNAVVRTLQSLSFDNERDKDRKDMISVISKLYHHDKVHFFFGHGALSHQHDLARDIPLGKDQKIRPIGITAIIYDGGMLFFFLIVMSALSTGYRSYRDLVLSNIPRDISFYKLSIPVVAIGVLFVTNTMDAVLWWLCISPDGMIGIFKRVQRNSMVKSDGFEKYKLINRSEREDRMSSMVSNILEQK